MELDIDVPSEHIDLPIVKQLVDLFYCSPKGDETVEEITPQIRDQVCMSRHLDRETPNQPYQYLVDVIIRIIMILASEPSTERALSCQKLICSDRPVNSSSAVLKARHWITIQNSFE
jgi:hypothetical protein